MRQFLSRILLIPFLIFTHSFSGGRLSFDLSQTSQANLWAEDLFINRQKPVGHTVDILPGNDSAHLHSSTKGMVFDSNLPPLMQALAYRYTADSGWYFGVNAMPVIKLVHLALGHNIQLTADGLSFGRYFGSGKKVLGKAEVFTTRGFLGARSALQYQLFGRGRFFVTANHLAGLATLPSEKRFLKLDDMVAESQAKTRLNAEFFTGLRMGYGVLSIGGGYRFDYKDQYDFKNKPEGSREVDRWAFAFKEANKQYQSVDEPEDQTILDAVKLSKKSIMNHRVMTDITLAFKRFHISAYCNSVLSPKLPLHTGVRLSIHF